MITENTQHKMSVFLADDNEDDVYFITRAFSAMIPDAKLHRSVNGQLLLEKLNIDNLPDLVILDLNMPVLDGRETLRLIRKIYGSSLPVVILTNSNHLHEKELCKEYGADSYFVKPYSYDGYQDIFHSLRVNWLQKNLVARTTINSRASKSTFIDTDKG